jgi:hypothetical protein
VNQDFQRNRGFKHSGNRCPEFSEEARSGRRRSSSTRFGPCWRRRSCDSAVERPAGNLVPFSPSCSMRIRLYLCVRMPTKTEEGEDPHEWKMAAIFDGAAIVSRAARRGRRRSGRGGHWRSAAAAAQRRAIRMTRPALWRPARHAQDDWYDKIPGQHRFVFDTARRRPAWRWLCDSPATISRRTRMRMA